MRIRAAPVAGDQAARGAAAAADAPDVARVGEGDAALGQRRCLQQQRRGMLEGCNRLHTSENQAQARRKSLSDTHVFRPALNGDQANAYRHSTNEATAPSSPCTLAFAESIR